MAVTRQEVAHVARLARLSLSEAETTDMTVQLNRILEHIDVLNEVDTSGVEPLSHPFDTRNVFRDDALRPSLTQEEALLNAPAAAEGHFLFPVASGNA
jgi:aspartyl-tRNA(Asn)/glutamyl-tRNA(Gln) amidotransferase subunit C